MSGSVACRLAHDAGRFPVGDKELHPDHIGGTVRAKPGLGFRHGEQLQQKVTSLLWILTQEAGLLGFVSLHR